MKGGVVSRHIVMPAYKLTAFTNESSVIMY